MSGIQNTSTHTTVSRSTPNHNMTNCDFLHYQC